MNNDELLKSPDEAAVDRMLTLELNLLRCVAALFIFSTALFSCNKQVSQFSEDDIAEAKAFVTSTIIPILIDDVADQSSSTDCARYELAVTLINKPESPSVLKWKKPIIRLDRLEREFIFFTPRHRPVLNLCSDNCIGSDDIPINVFIYREYSGSAGTWNEYESVMWNGISNYPSGHVCENIPF